ncbi:helix-turn-helix domain-containing protein [uncultured Ruminococcus sp.]|jgi:transcriptional regulator with XRE-family HTH domain|uniref:helix-turn-helix domain-containing protein n=1 Tax=uncultured Ruminococcus sp. TaxID=165186 RepID=UPI00266CFE96|nr:helix-turn-helix transcriptional regulator [uncultured Ruminococcus sp.]
MKSFYNIEIEQVRNGYTQESISKKLGVNRTTYRKWLDTGTIPVEKLIALSDLFDCSVDYLLGRSDVRKYAAIIQIA